MEGPPWKQKTANCKELETNCCFLFPWGAAAYNIRPATPTVASPPTGAKKHVNENPGKTLGCLLSAKRGARLARLPAWSYGPRGIGSSLKNKEIRLLDQSGLQRQLVAIFGESRSELRQELGTRMNHRPQL